MTSTSGVTPKPFHDELLARRLSRSGGGSVCGGPCPKAASQNFLMWPSGAFHVGVKRSPCPLPYNSAYQVEEPEETTMKGSLEPEITGSEAAGIFLVLCTALLLWIVWVGGFLDKLTALQIGARLFWNAQ